MRLLLFLAGINLLIIQFIMMREFSLVLFCTELVILIVGISYFIGQGVGYLISNRIKKPLIIGLAILTFFLHLHLPFIARYTAGFLAKWNSTGICIPLLFFIGAFLVSSFYTIFLPRFISEESPDSLPSYYGAELLGSMVGLLLILTLGQLSFMAIFLLYFVVLGGMAALLLESKQIVYFSIGLLIIYSFYFSLLDRKSSEYFYNNFYDRFKGKAQVLFSDHSPYQKIDILIDGEGNKSLYLNGLEYFNPSHLETFNFYLSEVPARLSKSSSALIVGSGSMSSVYHLHSVASEITTVEIDRKVYEAGRRFFKEYNHLDEITNWHLIIDDVKHYLKTTDRKFDLVVMDIPAPYYIQTALLFTKEFYAMVKERLAEEGIISVYLCNAFSEKKKELTSSRIIAAIGAVFNDFFIINSRSADNGFLIAGAKLPFGKEKVIDMLNYSGRKGDFHVFDKNEVMKVIGVTEPASFSNLDMVLDLNFWALPYDIDY